MVKHKLDKVLSSVPPEVIEAIRGDACDPVGVRALAAGRKLPRRHHANGCLACQFDAMQLRKQYAIREPALAFGLLLRTRFDELQREQGMRVEFSDRSTARLRLASSNGELKIVLDQLRVTGRMKVLVVALEKRSAEGEVGQYEHQFFLTEGRKPFRATVSETDALDPNLRYLIRLYKAPALPFKVEPPIIRLRLMRQEVRAAASKQSRQLALFPNGPTILTLTGGTDQPYQLEVTSTKAGILKLRFIGGPVPPGDFRLTVGGEPLELLSPFQDGCGAEVRAGDLELVLREESELEVRMSGPGPVMEALDEAIAARQELVTLVGDSEVVIANFRFLARDLAQAYVRRGDARYSARQFDDARRDYDEAIRLMQQLLNQPEGDEATLASDLANVRDKRASAQEQVSPWTRGFWKAVQSSSLVYFAGHGSVGTLTLPEFPLDPRISRDAEPELSMALGSGPDTGPEDQDEEEPSASWHFSRPVSDVLSIRKDDPELTGDATLDVEWYKSGRLEVWPSGALRMGREYSLEVLWGRADGVISGPVVHAGVPGAAHLEVGSGGMPRPGDLLVCRYSRVRNQETVAELAWVVRFPAS